MMSAIMSDTITAIEERKEMYLKHAAPGTPNLCK